MVSIKNRNTLVELKCMITNRLYCVRVFKDGRPVGRQLFKDFDSAWGYFDKVKKGGNHQ